MEYKKVVAWAIVLFMAFSIFGYVGSSFFSENENRKEYNGFTFYKSTSGWLVNLGDKKYIFNYLPQDIDNISFNGSTQDLLSIKFSGSTQDLLLAKRIYLIYEPGSSWDTSAAMNLMGTFFYRNGRAINKACAFEEGCPNDLPIRNCSENIGLLFKEDTELKLEVQDKCVVLHASDSFELNKLGERLIYSLLGII